MKKVFVILAMLAALALASEVVTIPLLANSNSVVESTSVENVGGGDNAIIAAVLSCIIPGLGQVYLGKVVRGLIIFGSWIGIFVVSSILEMIFSSNSTLGNMVSCVFTIISLVFQIWQIYDAYTLGGGKASASDDSDDEEDDDDVFVPLLRPVSQFNF